MARRKKIPELIILTPLGRHVSCTRAFCIFAEGVFETIDRLGCWDWVNIRILTPVSGTKFPAVRSTKLRRLGLRLIRVKLPNNENFSTYVCLDDLLEYIASMGKAPPIDVYLDKLLNVIRLVRTASGISRETKLKIFDKLMQCYDEVLKLVQSDSSTFPLKSNKRQ